MQGPGTDTQEVQRVRRALDDPQPQPFTVRWPSALCCSYVW